MAYTTSMTYKKNPSNNTPTPNKASVSVEDYITTVPTIARPGFDKLRNLVRATIPQARELVSYGILGYKIDDKRARVFISGWKDHLALYPIPQDELLRDKLQPYIKGKGTLWFSLDKPLPEELIVASIKALVK